MNIFKATLQSLEDYVIVAESWQDAFDIIANIDSSPVIYIEVLEYGVPVIGRARLEATDHLTIGKTYEELEAENLALQKQCEEKDAAITELRAQLAEYQDCNQDFFLKEIADRDNIIGEERVDMQKMQERINALVEENLQLLGRYNQLESANAGLRSQLANKDAIIKDKNQELEQLRATVPVGSPTGNKSSPCIHFSEGDQVLVSGAYFGETVPDHHGVIMGVMKDIARVLITEKDSDFEGDERYVPYEYITKQ